MAESMVTDIDELAKKKNETNMDHDGSLRRPKKRKRASLLEQLTAEERDDLIAALQLEIGGLCKYYREVLGERLRLDSSDSDSSNSVIAFFLEERDLSLSKLVHEIYQKVKDRDSGVTVASVKSSVLLLGQRSSYGVPNAGADVLEDESEEALWCWETRDLNLLPKSVRRTMKNRRTCRRKIHERIAAVSDMIAALRKSENNQNYGSDLRKASEMLGKALSEADIRLLQQSMEQKNDAKRVDKEAERERKQLMKQLERNKREAEKEKKRVDRELEREKKQSVKELKRLQDKAEREQKRREKEESELKKHIRRQQEEAEKYQRQKEKEEADKKKQLSMQKQASLMERFVKRSKTSATYQDDQSSAQTTTVELSSNRGERTHESVAQMFDYALSQYKSIDAEDLRKSHLIAWRCLGREIRVIGKQQWGIRRRPKTEVIKELKLSTSKGLAHSELSNDECETKADGKGSDTNRDDLASSSHGHCRYKQLLQFDKSHRPAFYGFWPRNSQIVGPRHPFKKDPDLDYDIDSDEEWEEEEPGESLSDCDKDDEEESLEEGISKVDEDDDNEDGFFVPDGYLSENEGVQVDRKEINSAVENSGNSLSSEQEPERDETCLLLRQQKHLNSLTEHALRRNQPLIIVNLMHDKVPSLKSEELTGIARLEWSCLQALSMRAFPGLPSIDISICKCPSEEKEDASTSICENHNNPVPTTTAILESDLPQIVSSIQVCSQSIHRIVESLQQKFPSVPKYLLRNKVREISDFADSRWQVKKDVLDKLGLSISPVKVGGRNKSIASFFSKRCLPPGNGGTITFAETSPESSQKSSEAVETQPAHANTQQQQRHVNLPSQSHRD